MNIAESYRINQGWENASVDVLPMFLSPYHWKLVLTNKDQYHVTYVNLIKKSSTKATTRNDGFIAQVRAQFKSANEIKWLMHDRYGKQTDMQDRAKMIWSLDMFSDIRHFMKFPALDRMEQRLEGTCGIFIDHRFVIDGLRTPPFQFGACQNKQQGWRLYRFKAGKGTLLK